MRGQGKRRKSQRNFFDRRKNDIRKSQQHNRERNPTFNSRKPQAPTGERSQNDRAILLPITNTVNSTIHSVESVVIQEPNSSLVQWYHPNASFEMLKEGVQASLPQGWTAVCHESAIQLCMVKVAPMAPPSVERSITIDADMSWYAHARQRVLTSRSSKLLSSFPARIRELADLLVIVRTVIHATVCPGNPDPEFVDVIEKRGGSLLGPDGQVVGVLDSTGEVTNHDGRVYGRTIRRYDCEVLLCVGEPTSASTTSKRCKSCVQYRNNIRSMAHRLKACSIATNTAHDSHTPYCRLDDQEKVQRLRNLQKEKKILKASNKKLQLRAQRLIENEGIKLTETESTDIEAVMKEASEKVDFPEDSFQCILWEEQKKHCALKNKRQMRWHPLVIRFALALRNACTSAYRVVSNSGFLSLPSERTLRDYTHWCSVSDGVQIPFIDHARNMMKDEGMGKDMVLSSANVQAN